MSMNKPFVPKKRFLEDGPYLFDYEDTLSVLGIAPMLQTEFAKNTIVCIFLIYKLFQEF